MNKLPRRVISGAQTGADQAGLWAAKRCGLQTGGWMPKGFRTLEGSRPDLAGLFGLQEHKSDTYPPRTFLNAKESDGTLRIALDFNSAGEKCTLKAVQQYRKPYFDIHVSRDPHDPEQKRLFTRTTIAEIRSWIQQHNIQTLNVAGNSEKTAPGIQAFGEWYLTLLFSNIKYSQAT